MTEKCSTCEHSMNWNTNTRPCCNCFSGDHWLKKRERKTPQRKHTPRKKVEVQADGGKKA